MLIANELALGINKDFFEWIDWIELKWIDSSELQKDFSTIFLHRQKVGPQNESIYGWGDHAIDRIRLPSGIGP